MGHFSLDIGGSVVNLGYQPRVTFITGHSLVVSWVSQYDEPGYVMYGAEPEALNAVAYDQRGEGTCDDTHHVQVADLIPGRAYYFEVVSGGVVHDNSGVPYEVATAPGVSGGLHLPDIARGGCTGQTGSLRRKARLSTSG